MTRPTDTEGGGRTKGPGQGFAAALRVGWRMAVALAVLTIVEYALITVTANLPIMVVVNLVEAGLIMIYFMHLPRLWRGREEER